MFDKSDHTRQELSVSIYDEEDDVELDTLGEIVDEAVVAELFVDVSLDWIVVETEVDVPVCCATTMTGVEVGFKIGKPNTPATRNMKPRTRRRTVNAANALAVPVVE